MTKKEMRIMHGVEEVAGQGIYSAQGLRQDGHDATMLVYRPDAYGMPYDRYVKIDMRKKWLYPWYVCKKIAFLVYALFRYDVFHFHFGYSLFRGNWDLRILRWFGKKIFFEFHGSDVRQPSELHRRNPYFNPEGELDSPQKDKANRKRCRFADGVVLHDDELLSYLPANLEKPIHIVPLRVDITRFCPVYPQANKERVTIVHAPSKRASKGTAYVLEAVHELQKKYDLEFILLENKPQEEAFEIYKKADIVIDQLIIGAYGVFAIEVMAMGKPVIVYISEEMKDTYPEELPVVSASPADIKEKIEQLILDGELRHSLGVKGRAYVERYHDYRVNAQIFYDIYAGTHAPRRGRDVFDEVLQYKRKTE